MPFGRPLSSKELIEKSKKYKKGSKTYNFFIREAERKKNWENIIKNKEKID